jgi:preprotein translocase subunit SecG
MENSIINPITEFYKSPTELQFENQLLKSVLMQQAKSPDAGSSVSHTGYNVTSTARTETSWIRPLLAGLLITGLIVIVIYNSTNTEEYEK